MDLNTCIKYLQFLANECDRHQADRMVTDEQLLTLSQEVERFQQQCEDSQLPEEVKMRIRAIDFHYSLREVPFENISILLGIFTFGIWVLGVKYIEHTRRVDALEHLKKQVSGIPMYIRMNFDLNS